MQPSTQLRAFPPAKTNRPVVMKRRRTSRQWLVIALLIAGCIFTVGPFLAILILALSPEGAPSIPYSWPERLTLDNLARVLGTQNFTTWTMNSLIYSIVSVMVILLTASMAGYSFAKKRFPGRDAIMWSFLATLMVPVQVTLIPLFVLIASLDGVNTYWGLIVPTLANSQAVFLMRQFIQGLPDDLFEAARIDGAGEWTIFFRIVLPLMKPILATLGIFVFLWHWNDFLWPLVIAQTDAMRTLTVGLASMNAETVYRSSLMAAAVISVIPCLIIFAVLQRYLVNSVAMTGIKG